MYEKNKNNKINLRLSDLDYNFLVELAEKRERSLSDVIRDILGEYRRSVIVLEKLKDTMQLANEIEGDIIKNGY